MKVRFIFLLILVLPVALFASGGRPPTTRPVQDEVRAIWVTRFDYQSQLDVSSIVVNCAKAGFTDIFFQVRGNGTAFYPSQVEPWAFELFGKDVSKTGTNPGWDPLLIASSWAKRYNVRLHAYINVLPGWRGMSSPPRSAGQLWTAHPDWFMVDSMGTRMRPTSAWYSFVNPAHPAVRSHLSAIAAELSRYHIAGLHLDYIRFPYDYKDVAREVYPRASDAEILKRSTFSFDPVSRRAVGPNATRKDWDVFRRNAVTQVVKDLKSTFESRKGKGAIISASVLADFSIGYHKAFQDSRLWTRKNDVDWVIPMNYNAGLYNERLANIQNLIGRRASAKQLVVGINCAGDAQQIRRQIAVARNAGCRGFALFAYSHLFENHRPTAKAAVLR